MNLDILKCPITSEILKEAPDVIIQKINTDSRNGQKIEKGLINQSEYIFYPIFGKVIALLPHYAIKLKEGVDFGTMQFDKERVFRYYNEVSYQGYEDNIIYADSNKWIDYREVSKAYMENSYLRAQKYLPKSGKYLLDIASGTIGFKEYLQLSDGFETRICIDISLVALFQAAANFKGRDGIFICGDITNIPLQDGICDAVLSQHTLYHIPKDEQARAVNELYRVCKKGGVVAIVYNWFFYSSLINITTFPFQLVRIARHIAGKVYVRFFRSKARLYFFVYPESWFRKAFAFGKEIEIYCWRSVNKRFLDLFIHESFGGKKILNWLQNKEDKYPKFFGKIGDYPILIIRKALY